MGAGILPVTISNGILLFLMGKERGNGLWADFGGSTDSGEQPIQTAIREGGEELNGILGIDDDLYKKVTESMISPVEFNKYTSFLFSLDYDKKLVQTFKNNNEFAEIYLHDLINKKHNGLFEKSEIKWFTINEMKNNIKLFRPHYIPIINTIIYHENIIKTSVNYYKKQKINKQHSKQYELYYSKPRKTSKY
tara:strand:- start:94 stop:669 length:576 start_codon:yes stop_codon:yes gene_type:complete